MSADRDEAPTRNDNEAMDGLLREYLAMVVELRNAPVTAATLRDADLSELALALGGSPDAIEARLRELIDADEQDVSELRQAILAASHPSLGVGHTPRFSSSRRT